MGYSTSIRSKRQRIVTALDIGTSKICCLIAKASPTPDWLEDKSDAMQFEVLGFDHTRAEGLKAGMIAHLDSAEACIRSAVDTAERMAGVTVEEVHVSVTCGRLKSETFSASVALPSGSVREDDLRRLLSGGRQYAGREKRSVLHALPVSYRLDDNDGISEPQGMCGERLAVDLHAVTADEVAMRNVMLCVERCHLGVASLIAAP
jgi:cell division protein FtsA